MRERRFVPIAFKVNVIILSSLIVGLGALSAYYSRTLSRTLEDTTRANLKRQSQILFLSIENFMLPGEAPLAVKFFSDIGRLHGDFSIRLFRTNGTPAFSDSATIDRVNANLGRKKFEPRKAGAATAAAAGP